MKDAIKKIQALVEDIHETADTSERGCYIIIADGPTPEEGQDAHSLISTVAGYGGELTFALIRTFQNDRKFAGLMRRALALAEIAPDLKDVEAMIEKKKAEKASEKNVSEDKE